MSDADLAIVSAEDGNGRVLSGVGTTVEALQETMERYAPEESPAEAGEAAGQPTPATSTEPVLAGDEKVSRGRKRYSQLTSERDKALNAAAEVAKERDELRARLAQQPPPVPAPERPQPTVPAEKFTFPTYEAFVAQHADASYDDWTDAKVDAIADWKLSKVDFDARIRHSIEADRASRAEMDVLQQAWTRARTVYPDFDAIRSGGPGASIPLGATPQAAQARIQAIIQSPQSEHLQYAIAKDASLAHKLASLSDVQFGMALAQLAPTAPATSPASTGFAGSVTAPIPYQPVGSGSKTTVPSSGELAKKGFNFDESGYRERRAAERGVKARSMK